MYLLCKPITFPSWLRDYEICFPYRGVYVKVFYIEKAWVKDNTLQFQSRCWSHCSMCCGNLSHFIINATFPSCFLLESNSQREAFDFQTVSTILRESDPFCGFAFSLGRGGGTHECLVNQTELSLFHFKIKPYIKNTTLIFRVYSHT